MAADAPPASQPTAEAPASQPAGPAPKFRCDKLIHEFPDAWAGGKVEHTFIVHNDGDVALEIINVKPSCGCTVAGQFDKTIEPGKEGKIPVALTTARLNTTLEKTITVETNDPANKTVLLKLKGKVKMRIVVEPVGASWQRLSPQSPETITIKVTNNTETPMKLEPIVEPQQTMFEATVKEVEPGKAAEIIVKLNQPVREGNIVAQLRFKTGIEAEPEISIPANAFKPALLEVQPSAISASIVAGTSHKQNITFRYNGDKTMKITGTTASDPAIQTQLTEAEPGKVSNLMVTFPPGFEASDEKPAQIVVNTDVEGRDEINIPIRIRVNTPATQPAVVAEAMAGKPAPGGILKDPEGRNVNIGGASSDITVINFWASWCAVCKKQLPILQKVHEVYSKKGIRFVMVSTDGKIAPQEIVNSAKKLQVTIPIALDPVSALAQQYGATHIPTLYIINKKGVIEKVHRGSPPALENDLKTELDALIEGKTLVQPAAAPAPPVGTRPAQAAGPALIIEPVNQDMGQQKPGEKVQYTVNYRNGGTEPVSVKSVKPSEGLEVEAGYATKLEPNASSAFKCTFTAPKKPGAIAHELAIETNEPNPRKIVKLTGNVRPYVEFQPPIGVTYPRIPRTQKIPSLVTLVYNGEGKIEYSKPESSSPKFEAIITPMGDGPFARLEVTAKPPFEPGDNIAVIHVKTSCKEQPMVDVPVKLFLPARIEVSPAEVILPASTRLQRSEITIRNNGENSINILNVKTSNDQIRTQFFPEPDGMSYRLRLIIPAATDPAGDKEERNEKVTIRTDDPEFGEIVIPVRVGGPAAPTADKVSQVVK